MQAKKPRTIGFTDWLATQQGRDDAIGDLAREADGDLEFPDTRDAVVMYLYGMRPTADALAELDRVWTAFERAMQRRGGR